MLIIPRLFPAVKQPILLHQLFQVALPDAVKGHDRVLAVWPVCFHHQPYNDIQIGLRETLYCKDCSDMLFIHQQNIRLQDGFLTI